MWGSLLELFTMSTRLLELNFSVEGCSKDAGKLNSDVYLLEEYVYVLLPQRLTFLTR